MAQPGLLLDDRYRLDDRIAAGGMGEVWRATDLSLHRQVAVKLMRSGYAQDAEGLARFRAEARYAGSLAHANIAVVYDYWEGDPPGQPYLVMELVEGPSLAGVLEQGAIGVPATLDVVAQTATGLQVAHEAGVVHRDIKPANLLVSPGGLIKISDFGIARADTSATLTSVGQVIGTVAYMAPERVVGRPATAATDLYALGVVAYECLTGKRPFDGEPLAVALAHQQRGLPPLPAGVPAEVARLVADLTAKDPAARPATAGQVAARAHRLRAVITGAAGGQLADAAADWLAAGDSFPAPGRTAEDAAYPVTGAQSGGGYSATATYASGGPRPGGGGYPGSGTYQDAAGYPGSGTYPGAAGYPDGDEAGQSVWRRLPVRVGVGAGAAVVAGLVAWLAFASSQPTPHRPMQAARHSSAPATPVAAPSQSLVNQTVPPPVSSAPATLPPTPTALPSASPTPTVAPSPTVAPTPTAQPTATPTVTATP